MSDTPLPSNVAGLVAIGLGIVLCFLGYRILKLTLGIAGFVVGATGGWELGSALAPGNNAIGLIAAAVGGVLGAVLCIWLFFLGVFLLGASAGAIMASALFSAAGTQSQAILILVFAAILGVIALVLQKFMIILSTAFGGSYLICTGILQLVGGSPDSFRVLFHEPIAALGLGGYAVLALWLFLGLAGISVQYRSSKRSREASVRTDSSG